MKAQLPVIEHAFLLLVHCFEPLETLEAQALIICVIIWLYTGFWLASSVLEVMSFGLAKVEVLAKVLFLEQAAIELFLS